jgi:hypothetical protein
MDTTPPSADYLAFVDEALRTWPDIEAGHMFGVPNLKRHRKAFACGYAGGAVFRLPDDDYDMALQLEGTEPFDPAERGTSMGTWVIVPATFADRWMAYARAALDHLNPTTEALAKEHDQ